MQRRYLLFLLPIVMAVLCVSAVTLVAEDSGKSEEVVSIAKKTSRHEENGRPVSA